MTEIRFYHMERSTLETTLPALLNKALMGGHKIVIKCDTPNNVEALNNHLWAYDPNSFIPHGTQKDGFTEDQPVFLTDKDENPGSADVLILTGGTTSENIKDFTLCCEMLNGNDEKTVSEARERWKLYKDEGFEVTYWQQGQSGWEKKA